MSDFSSWFFDRFLVRLISRERAFLLRLWLFRFGALSLVSLVLPVLFAAWFLWFSVEPHRHVRYETSEVLGTLAEVSFRGNAHTLVHLRLNDGTVLHLMSPKSIVPPGPIDTVCVERRQWVESGSYRFRLVRADYCVSANQISAQTN